MNLLRVVIIVFFIALLFGGFLFYQEIFVAKDPGNLTEISFLIEPGQGFFSIAENLEKEGLIKNKIFFQVYVALKGKTRNLQPGTYTFSPSMSVSQIAQKIFLGGSVSIKITIPEGFNLKQIEEELSSKLKTQSAKLQLKTKNLESYKDEFDFLKDSPDNASLEGFLFPDTYFFDNSTAEEVVIKTFLKNFEQKFTLHRDDVSGAGLTTDLREEVRKQGKTVFKIVTMASLLEKEVKTLEEKKIVAGILWKRLENNFPLQVDATIAYITGKKSTKVSREDTQIDSPYNTYKYLGLPVGPICNPGMESILAAIYPQGSSFWYYLSIPDGETIFSQTLEQHNIAKAKYLSR